MQERVNTHPPGARAPTVCVAAGLDASSQHVDDVGEEDEAHDGEEHQHQNVHHDGNNVRDGRWRCTTYRQLYHRSRRSAEIGTDRKLTLQKPEWRNFNLILFCQGGYRKSGDMYLIYNPEV